MVESVHRFGCAAVYVLNVDRAAGARVEAQELDASRAP